MKYIKNNRLLIHVLISTAVYTLGYLCVSFVTWNLGNPFQWLIDMPNTDEGQRFGYLSILITYQLVIFAMSSSRKDGDKKVSPTQ